MLRFAIYFGFLLATQWLPVISGVDWGSSEERDFIASQRNPKFKTFGDTDSDEIYTNYEYQDELDATYRKVKKNQYNVNVKLDKTLKGGADWDVLIFTQQWPVTTCYHWREEDKNHKCLLPSKKEFWTVHGIWPTKLGHIGPNFCNNSAKFDINQLNGIINEMKQFWPDIDGEETEYTWLWQHEWLKHGTCAAILSDLNNEAKYFGQGINWRNAYLISNILGQANIHPDSNNTVVAIQTALYEALGKNPSIHCLYNNKKDISLLSEIRICFNKSLELIDCDGTKLDDVITIDYPGGTLLTNCHISKPVYYPSLVPAIKQKPKTDKWKFPIVNIYKFVQLLIWLTF